MNPMLKKRASNGAHCHLLVAKTAQEMAHEVYDALMDRDEFYTMWKNNHPELKGKALEDQWVKQNWGKFVEQARATLAQTLTQPIDFGLKKQIYEALILDAQLVRGRLQGVSRLN